MELLRHDSFLWIGAKSRFRKIVEQDRVGHFLGGGGYDVTETDIYLQCDTRAFELGARVDSHASIPRFLSDKRARDGAEIELNRIFDRDRTDLAEFVLDRLDVAGTEAKQVDIARWPVRGVVPQ